MNFRIDELLHSLGHLTGRVLSASTSHRNNHQKPPHIDFSFITPSIIALGDIPDSKLDDIVQLIQDDPCMIWSLGASKPLSPEFTESFHNQILECPWKTPSQYTRAPNLSVLVNVCHSIKSWLDLYEKNICIIHCPIGQPYTGIVIACLLKYIKAFDHSSHAYDFYCSKR